MNDKRRDGLTEFDVFGGLDPAVDSLIERGVRRQAEAHLPGRERKKKARERAKAKARLPRRVNWDLPIWIKEAMVEIAVQHRVPVSQVAALFLKHSLIAYRRKEIDLSRYRVPSESPRYEWILELGDSDE
jgi:hypothetical protein